MSEETGAAARSHGAASAVPDGNARRALLVAFAALVALIPSSASIAFYAQGYFVGPVTEEFGWTRTQFMSAVSIGITVLAMAYPLMGYLGDRYGVRPVLLIGVLLYGLGTMSLALIGSDLLVYTILTMLVTVAALVQSPLLYAKAIAGWAPKRIRGTTLAIGVTGIPLGNFLIPIATVWLITHYGWRGGRIGLGLIILLVALPIILAFIKEPVAGRAASREATLKGPGLWRGLGGLARDPVCRLLFLTLLLGGAALNGLLAHLIPMMTDRSFTLGQATTALSMMAVAGAAGRLASGWLLDRVQNPRIGLLWFLLGIAGVALASVAMDMAVMIPAIVLVGLAVGAEVELAAYYATRYFSLARFGESYGVLSAAYSFGTAGGSLVFGLSFDTTGSYFAASLVAIGLLAVSCLAIFLLPPYPDEERPA
jgi:MFS family permease